MSGTADLVTSVHRRRAKLLIGPGEILAAYGVSRDRLFRRFQMRARRATIGAVKPVYFRGEVQRLSE